MALSDIALPRSVATHLFTPYLVAQRFIMAGINPVHIVYKDA
jgi:hypothetical protein